MCWSPARNAGEKKERQLYVPDVHKYTENQYATMMIFTRDREHAFVVRPLTYSSGRNQVMFGVRHLTGETSNEYGANFKSKGFLIGVKVIQWMIVDY